MRLFGELILTRALYISLHGDFLPRCLNALRFVLGAFGVFSWRGAVRLAAGLSIAEEGRVRWQTVGASVGQNRAVKLLFGFEYGVLTYWPCPWARLLQLGARKRKG